MIRRDGSAAEGTAGQWVLISQVDHAQLAGQLAEHWGSAGVAPLEPRDELLWTIYHHDDGWCGWEQSPDVDPASGKPRSFTEMPLADSLEIWEASIALACHGYLPCFLVASHFCALGRRSAAWRKHDPLWPRAEQFLAGHESLATQCREDWQSKDPRRNTPQVAQRALEYLQFFDSLSLWFCCAVASGPDRVTIPGGPILTLEPVNPRHVRLSPWPFDVDTLKVAVPGRAVPVGRYSRRDDLAAMPAQPVLLSWLLEPGLPNR